MFRAALVVDPFRTAGLDYYSTALWQLKEKVNLAHLAQQAVESDKLSAEVWIAVFLCPFFVERRGEKERRQRRQRCLKVGNCFSLQGECTNALKFFRRASALSPFLPYAHSLLGHEFLQMGDTERARVNYQRAIGHSPSTCLHFTSHTAHIHIAHTTKKETC